MNPDIGTLENTERRRLEDQQHEVNERTKEQVAHAQETGTHFDKDPIARAVFPVNFGPLKHTHDALLGKERVHPDDETRPVAKSWESFKGGVASMLGLGSETSTEDLTKRAAEHPGYTGEAWDDLKDKVHRAGGMFEGSTTTRTDNTGIMGTDSKGTINQTWEGLKDKAEHAKDKLEGMFESHSSTGIRSDSLREGIMDPPPQEYGRVEQEHDHRPEKANYAMSKVAGIRSDESSGTFIRSDAPGNEQTSFGRAWEGLKDKAEYAKEKVQHAFDDSSSHSTIGTAPSATSTVQRDIAQAWEGLKDKAEYAKEKVQHAFDDHSSHSTIGTAAPSTDQGGIAQAWEGLKDKAASAWTSVFESPAKTEHPPAIHTSDMTPEEIHARYGPLAQEGWKEEDRDMYPKEQETLGDRTGHVDLQSEHQPLITSSRMDENVHHISSGLPQSSVGTHETQGGLTGMWESMKEGLASIVGRTEESAPQMPAQRSDREIQSGPNLTALKEDYKDSALPYEARQGAEFKDREEARRKGDY
jgi:uncharacterized protein YjbJ (UPF0337 family)